MVTLLVATLVTVAVLARLRNRISSRWDPLLAMNIALLLSMVELELLLACEPCAYRYSMPG